MSAVIKIQIDESLYIRDPEQTELGRKIIVNSIKLIERQGFEKFTFKKLANDINSTESSVYRYFENKHQLLTYLVSWYWNWLSYQIDYQTNNIAEAERKLKIVIKVLSESIKYDPNFSHIDEVALSHIVITESTKAYTNPGQNDIELSLFKGYKELCSKVSTIIKEVNPAYPKPLALVSSIIETAHKQIFFAKYAPFLTELKVIAEDNSEIALFLENLVFQLIKKN